METLPLFENLSLEAPTGRASDARPTERPGEKAHAEQVNPEQVNAEQVNIEQVNAEQINAEQINAEQINSEKINAEQKDAELSDEIQHMQSAMRLASDLEERHKRRAYLITHNRIELRAAPKNSAQKNIILNDMLPQRSETTRLGTQLENELASPAATANERAKQSANESAKQSARESANEREGSGRVGNAICEHLLAALRAQVAREAGGNPAGMPTRH